MVRCIRKMAAFPHDVVSSGIIPLNDRTKSQAGHFHQLGINGMATGLTEASAAKANPVPATVREWSDR